MAFIKEDQRNSAVSSFKRYHENTEWQFKWGRPDYKGLQQGFWHYLTKANLLNWSMSESVITWICDNSLSWVGNFLTHQKYLLMGSHLKIPQGRYWEPLLFLIYINNLPTNLQSTVVRLFADDCILYCETENSDNTKIRQQDIINYVNENVIGR